MNLKRLSTFIFTVATILFSLNANAQDQRFRIGLKFSANLSWISPVSRNIEKVGSSLGTSYGVMADYNFQKYYALSMEFLFTDIAGSMIHTDRLQYTDSNGSTSHSNVQYDYKFKYLQLPISIKFKTKEFGYWTYWAQFGLAPSFLTQATADISGKTVPFDDPTDIRVNKTINDEFHYDNFDDKIFFMRLPLIMGAGVEYSIAGNTALYAGIRMDNNFLNIFVADDITQAKNNFASFNVGVFF